MAEGRSGSVTIEVRSYDRGLVKKASGFSCGHPDLDDWLRMHAGKVVARYRGLPAREVACRVALAFGAGASLFATASSTRQHFAASSRDTSRLM